MVAMTPLQVAKAALEEIMRISGPFNIPARAVARAALARIAELEAQCFCIGTDTCAFCNDAQPPETPADEPAKCPAKGPDCTMYGKLTTFDPDCPCQGCTWHRRYLHDKHFGPAAEAVKMAWCETCAVMENAAPDACPHDEPAKVDER